MGVARWQPKWWTTEHASSWERIRDAMKRDWEQTKNDLGAGGRDLDQDVDDTVKQAAGKQPIPPVAQANAPGGGDGRLPWDDAEPALAYGYGAAHKYGGQAAWDDRVESDLRSEWETGQSSGLGRKWEDVKSLVRRGYERARS
jgi:hypothetical protein